MPGIGLKSEEIAKAFDCEDLRRRYPPIMGVAQIADMLGLSSKTVYLWIARGRLDGSFRKRGKHILLWRDRAIDILFNAPEWDSTCEE